MASRFFHPLWPGGLAKAFTLSYDDGVSQDERLIALFDQYGVKGTFNLNSGLTGHCGSANGQPYPATHNRFTEDQIPEMYRNHEIAIHGYQHLDLPAYPISVAATDVLKDRLYWESLLHRPVTGMAYAFGTYNDEVIEMLRTLGIAYSRTTKATLGFDLPKDFLAWHPTAHHSHPELPTLLQTFAEDETPNLKLCYVWGHSYEFDGHRNWELIEDLLKIVAGRDDIWYATNGEIYRYIKAFDQLIYSADGQIIENPTAHDLWIWVWGLKDKVCLKAGSVTEIGTLM